jgi:transposase
MEDKMARGRPLKKLNLTEVERLELNRIIDSPKSGNRLRHRARIILSCATDASNKAVANQEKVSMITVGKLRSRFLENRLDGLRERPRSGRPSKVVPETLIVHVSNEQRSELERFASRPKTGQALARRCRIILASSDGLSDTEIAGKEGVSRQTVGKWKRRFLAGSVDGLLDEPRPGAPRKLADEDVEKVITKTLEATPVDATHWSTRSMAKATGMSQSAISRIWRAFGLQPHRVETFKLSKDPLFIEKVRDIVGLYINPPERAVVLCVDEKSQIQALDRMQPLLPMRPGQAERRTHDYKRYGTTSLFAALNYATGEVTGRCFRRHRTVEFRKFLDLIDKSVPKKLEVHLILDNYGTHKTALIHNWLLKRPRFHLHFTPTSASWLNLVERWFAELTEKQIRRNSFRSTNALEKAIVNYLDTYNSDPRPFIWTKTADQILENIKKFCERTYNS